MKKGNSCLSDQPKLGIELRDERINIWPQSPERQITGIGQMLSKQGFPSLRRVREVLAMMIHLPKSLLREGL